MKDQANGRRTRPSTQTRTSSELVFIISRNGHPTTFLTTMSAYFLAWPISLYQCSAQPEPQSIATFQSTNGARTVIYAPELEPALEVIIATAVKCSYRGSRCWH